MGVCGVEKDDDGFGMRSRPLTLGQLVSVSANHFTQFALEGATFSVLSPRSFLLFLVSVFILEEALRLCAIHQLNIVYESSPVIFVGAAVEKVPTGLGDQTVPVGEHILDRVTVVRVSVRKLGVWLNSHFGLEEVQIDGVPIGREKE